MALRTGLRATEIFKLRGQDVDAAADVLYIIAKGGSRTAVRIPADIAAMLREYHRNPGEPLFKTPESGGAFIQIPPGFRRAVNRLGLAPKDGDSLYDPVVINNFAAITFRVHALRQQFSDLQITLAQFPHTGLLHVYRRTQSCVYRQ